MSWKQTVYDYVHFKNQSELDYRIDPIAALVDDESYLAARQSRLARLSASDLQRDIRLVKQETRLKLLNAEPFLNGVTVDIKLNRTSESFMGNHPLTERRIELQRLVLSQGSDGWRIRRVEEIAAERPGMTPAVSGPSQYDAADKYFDHAVKTASLPLLNNEMLSRYTPSYRAVAYNRQLAVQYADTHWDVSNPKFLTFEVNCTNYVSQCLFAGGAPMNYTGKRASGWWYRGRIGGQEQWSYSWAVANSLQTTLATSRIGLRAEEVSAANQLVPGDVIAYNWDGASGFEHTTIVTRIDPNGMPLVNANTISSQHRYWDYRDSHAWTPNTRYRFFHIADLM